jgi:C-terminal processing protease CtpA/Prc
LIVLVDARSASVAELYPCVIQLKKGGVVRGDKTEGAVIQAKHYEEQAGADTVIFNGAYITEWDLVMRDGKSLEHSPVTANELLLPSATAIANGRDPVLACS